MQTIAAHSVPIGAYSVPAVHCVDVPASARRVGVISVPHCVVFNPDAPGRGLQCSGATPATVPVADSSTPRCVEIATATTTIRRC